ncbi:hypothetical protein PR048_029743, partial [Dryococelus australis]
MTVTSAVLELLPLSRTLTVVSNYVDRPDDEHAATSSHPSSGDGHSSGQYNIQESRTKAEIDREREGGIPIPVASPALRGNFLLEASQFRPRLAQPAAQSGNALKGPTSSSHVMLPSNKLPHFTGNLAAWINFSNLFEIVIVNNQDLSKVEQLTYLKLDLKGCLALLVKQYDNKLLIMIHHTDTILQVLVAHLDSTAFMRYLLSKMNENMAALKALKLAVDQWDILLLDLLEKSVRVDLRKIGNASLVKQLERGEPDQPHFKLGTTTVHILLLQPQYVVCVKVNTLLQYVCPEKFKRKAHKLCINCLQPLHMVRNCPLCTSCSHCSFRHHSPLHFTI